MTLGWKRGSNASESWHRIASNLSGRVQPRPSLFKLSSTRRVISHAPLESRQRLKGKPFDGSSEQTEKCATVEEVESAWKISADSDSSRRAGGLASLLARLTGRSHWAIPSSPFGPSMRRSEEQFLIQNHSSTSAVPFSRSTSIDTRNCAQNHHEEHEEPKQVGAPTPPPIPDSRSPTSR